LKASRFIKAAVVGLSTITLLFVTGCSAYLPNTTIAKAAPGSVSQGCGSSLQIIALRGSNELDRAEAKPSTYSFNQGKNHVTSNGWEGPTLHRVIQWYLNESKSVGVDPATVPIVGIGTGAGYAANIANGATLFTRANGTQVVTRFEDVNISANSGANATAAYILSQEKERPKGFTFRSICVK
jgi:hypothetical protein